MYTSSTTACSQKHRCRGQATSITYLEGVSSFSDPACKACELYYIAICGLSGSTMFCPIITLTTWFQEK
jgi:hypothetical protein